MVRSAVADESFLNYLTKLAKPGACTVGLILGQPTPHKDYIIHLAKTPTCNSNTEKPHEIHPKLVLKFADVLDVWVADHAKHATRMLPGGMFVLGIFVVSQEDILTPFSSKIKTMLLHIHKRLSANKFLFGNSDSAEKLVLNYCTKTQLYACKSYNTETSVILPAEIKFQSNLTIKWLQLECKYELEQTIPIIEERSNWALKKHMQDILTSINDNFKSAIFMFDGEIKDKDDYLETVGKKRKAATRKLGHHESIVDTKPMQVTILLPCESKGDGQVILRNCSGQIKLVGQVASKLWLHPKATVDEASNAVTQDLVRSLAARLEMHWDSLIEEEHGSPEDTNTIHEPPRRVLVTLPTSNISLSDYLFPGEGPQEAKISLEELLDIKIADQDIKDVEGQAELNELYNEGIESENEEMYGKMPKTKNKYIYFAGIVIAFLVLVISITLHFLRDYF